MPIEFPCPQCETTLRVPDGAAGKDARCPACKAIVPIPGTMAVPPPSSPVPQSENPYRSPAGIDRTWERSESNLGPRSGPAWERDGKSISSFFATCRECFSNPASFFEAMRREGGLWAPLLFGVIANYVASLVNFAYQFAFAEMQAGFNFRNNPALPPEFVWVILGVTLVLGPIFSAIGLYIYAVIFHLSLLALGGARFGFETTLRVVCYTVGTASLLLLIPLCGPYLNGLAMLIFVGIGFAKAHEIPGGKAAGAVILPILGCCMLFVAYYGVIFAFAGR